MKNWNRLYTILKCKFREGAIMNVIVCIDNLNGMLFNSRRQSRDRNQIADMFSLVNDAPLYIQSFSAKLLADTSAVIKDDCLETAGNGTYCFIESSSIVNHIDRIENLVVYRWNRDYPADFYFDVDLSDWDCVDRVDFEGFSHEKITREIYRK